MPDVDGGSEPAYLFVYGTLMSSFGGMMHDLVARHATLVGGAAFAGRLYDAGTYPAAVPSSGASRDRVRGELYRLDPHTSAELLGQLDDYEGCAEGLFRRVRATVAGDDRRPVAAWVYVYARSTARLRCVESGDWAAERGREGGPPPDGVADGPGA